MAAPKGRPSIYSEKLALEICDRVATTSNSLKTICEEEGMPSITSVFRWLRDREEFRKQYTRAKEEQADYLVEEMIAIADDGSNDYMTITKGDAEYNVEDKEVTNRSKLRVETRKWIASKLKPKKYGDKLEVEGNINTNTELIITGKKFAKNSNEDNPNA